MRHQHGRGVNCSAVWRRVLKKAARSRQSDHPGASEYGGSSPRARGTRRGHAGLCHLRRFIPASAGNTSPHPPPAPPPAVHPRERGEHRASMEKSGPRTGSSPRARGTLSHSGPRESGRRFIPASAGNTRTARTQSPSASVHPRERGEHSTIGRCRSPGSGSSPRARGTQVSDPGQYRHARFIPASAGNTALTARAPTEITVHPRERGEHALSAALRSENAGSSPRARGTPRRQPDHPGYQRFIPASAGNTARTTPLFPAWSVHPRERGEHLGSRALSLQYAGSSPRARGTRRHPG